MDLEEEITTKFWADYNDRKQSYGVQQNVDLRFLRPYLDSFEEEKKIYRYRIPEGVQFEFDMNAMKNYFGVETLMNWQRDPHGYRCYLDLQLISGINYNIGHP